MNLPNKITVFRFCCIPLLMFFSLVEFKYHWVGALLVYFIACMSDKALSRKSLKSFNDFSSNISFSFSIKTSSTRNSMTASIVMLAKFVHSLNARSPIKAVKKDIARIKTVERQIELESSNS